jgi:hypothetical protein
MTRPPSNDCSRYLIYISVHILFIRNKKRFTVSCCKLKFTGYHVTNQTGNRYKRDVTWSIFISRHLNKKRLNLTQAIRLISTFKQIELLQRHGLTSSHRCENYVNSLEMVVGGLVDDLLATREYA